MWKTLEKIHKKYHEDKSDKIKAEKKNKNTKS